MTRQMCGKVLLLSLLTPLAALAAPYGSTYEDAAGYGVETLENRVAKLEKKLGGQALAKMASDTEKLQSEVLKLRGELEKAENELERLRRQHKEDYATMDQRLQQLIANQSVMQAQIQAGTATTTPAAGTTAAPGTDATGQSTEQAPGSPGQGGAAAVSPPAPGQAPEVPPPPPRELAYQKAFATLKDGKYGDAIKEFKSFLGAYPNGDYADNAQYWLAEAQYVTKDYGAARSGFEQVVKGFPQSAKVSDAMLKIGLIDYDRGDYAGARTALSDVVKRYPGSSAARLAEKRLERIQQEGR